MTSAAQTNGNRPGVLDPRPEKVPCAKPRTAKEIQSWLVAHLSAALRVNPADIDIHEPFASAGLSSAEAVVLTGDLEDWLDVRLSPTLAWEHPTIDQLVRHLAGLQGTTESDNHREPHTGLATDAIAIVGVGCRFPGAADPESFWRLLEAGKDAITELPASRWSNGYQDDRASGTPVWGGFLRDVDLFDPQFFGISPKEAARIDPQHRLVLEIAWEALEDAGQAPDKLAGSPTGVFIGISTNDYSRLQFANRDNLDVYAATGNAFSIAANRLSYLLDLKGPSLAIDTACSSSLVAVHLACESLRRGECTMALAGGVNLLLAPELTLAFANGRMMAVDGRCKTFDASADGYVRGEGCGIVVLKKFSDAVENRDRILALVRGSAINQDGRSNGLTAPHGPAQQAVIRQALKNAGVAPSQISYLEAHGTGTALGDPIEVQSLWEVLRENRSQEDPCALGSVKTNIGHLEAAAGIAGLIKTALCLKHRKLAAHLHLQTINPHIPLRSMALVIPTSLQPWITRTGNRIAGVSSFGFGGTNAHVILEEASIEAPRGPVVERPLHILSLSAQSETGLRELCSRYADHLDAHPDLAAANVCFAANAGRSHFGERLTVTGSTTRELSATLRNAATAPTQSGSQVRRTRQSKRPKIAMLYTGQGSQYPAMGRELYETQPTFRKVMEECDEILRGELEQPLLSVLYSAAGDPSQINNTVYTQPALFALECALTETWRSWGIRPDIVLGHSVGAYAAAYAAGVFGLEDGLRLIAKRASLMQTRSAAGRMMSVFADLPRVAGAIAQHAGYVSIAAVNGPSHILISGEPGRIQMVVESLQADGVLTQPLPGSRAFHSPLMEPVLEPFKQSASNLQFKCPVVPFVSDTTGMRIEDGAVPGVDYWSRHLREAVQYAKGIETTLAEDCDLFLEIGPTPSLLAMAKRCVPKNARSNRDWLASLNLGQGDWVQLLASLGTLYVRGADVDWSGFDRDYPRYRVPLPTYPFERKRHWIESAGAPQVSRPQDPHPDGNELPSNPKTKEPRTMNTDTEAFATQSLPAVRSTTTRRDAIVATVSGIVARLLELDVAEINVHARLLEMGADSLVLLEAVRTIEKTYGLHLTIRQMFEELTTLDALATYIDRTLPQDVSPAVPDQVSPEAERPVAQAAIPLGRINGAASAPGSSLERIMSQQLEVLSRVMLEQVELLRSKSDTANGAPSSHATPLELLSKHVAPLSIPAPAVADRNPASSNGHAAAPAGQRETEKAPEPFMPYRPIQPGSLRSWDPKQQAYVQSLTSRFTGRTRMSKQLVQAQRSVHADLRNSLNFHLSTKEMCYPIIAARSQGSKIWDVDGNQYVDLTMGFGANLFGHGEAFIQDAIASQMKLGMHLGPQSDLAGEVAALICELTGMERVTFCNSGTEAVMVALRLARAATGRAKAVIFTGSYHGASDGILAAQGPDERTLPMAPGVTQGMVNDVLVLPYGTSRSLEILKASSHELAAVLVEPVQSRRPGFQPKDFLQQVREITRSSGTALIFDEVITGFRIHPGGAQAWFGIEADLATYGKVVGGGMPIGLVAGRNGYMDGIDGGAWQYGDHSYPSSTTTFYSGTFCKHPLAMSAARAVLKRLKADGPDLQMQLNRRCTELVETLNAYFKAEAAPMTVAQFGSLFRFTWPMQLTFAEDPNLFFCQLIEQGIYIWEGRNCFLSTAHTKADIDRVVEAVKKSVAAMRDGGFLQPSESRLTAGSKTSAPSSQNIPLTESQKNLWILTQMGEAAHETVTVEFQGALDVPALEHAFQKVVTRHDALRTRINTGGDSQEILPAVEFHMPAVDFTDHDPAEREIKVAEWLMQESRRPFDLSSAPLCRVHILKTDEQKHRLVLSVHHIVVDGWSVGVILQEVSRFYTAACKAENPELPASMHLAEYVRWQSTEDGSTKMAVDEDYWLKELSGDLPVLELPTDQPRPAVKTYQGASESLTIDAGRCQELKQLSQQQGCTLFMTLLGAYFVFLHRITSQDDIVIGFPVSGRSAPDSENLVAYCSHLLPIRSLLSGDVAFGQYLAGIRAKLLEAYEHQDYPFARLLQKLNPVRDPSRSPIINATFNLERNIGLPAFHGLTADLLSPPVSSAEHDLHLNVTEVHGKLLIDLTYNTGLFAAATIKRMLGHFHSVLMAIAANPNELISMVPLLPERERQQLLVDWNDTGKSYRDLCFHQRFEAQVDRTPLSPALIFQDEQVSYSELDKRANCLAHYLQVSGSVAGTLVGVCMERSPEMLVALLGIAKAGAAWVALDPAYPRDRLAYMMEDAEVSVLLTQGHLVERVPHHTARVVCVDSEWPSIQQSSEARLDGGVTLDSLAYVIYTSGSTGRPKGILIPHRGLANYLAWCTSAYEVEKGEGAPVHSSISFDLTITALFAPLLAGRAVELLAEAPGIESLSAALEEKRNYSLIKITPLHLELLRHQVGREQARGLTRRFVIGGENLLGKDLAFWQEAAPETVLVNEYGPSETVVGCCVYSVGVGEARTGSVPIGRPIANTQLYVVDKNLQAVPVGVPGELLVGGQGLAWGYLKRAELTAEKFIPSPFGMKPGERLYRTGDLVRHLPDGNLEYLGRIDHQVKIRGYRIELGEIEALLDQHPSVKQSLVLAREDEPGRKRLVGYVVSEPGQTTTTSELREYLAAMLPDYAVPSAFVWLDAMPLSANGKVDRRALPAPLPARPDLRVEFVAPRNRTEELLAEIWAEAFKVDAVGIHDNFFELGGDSIQAIQIAAQANKIGIGITIDQLLFDLPTISQLAAVTSGAANQDPSQAKESEQFAVVNSPQEPQIEDTYPLSPMQRGMLYHCLGAPQAGEYLEQANLTLHQPLNVPAFKQAWQQTINCHPVLRTAFVWKGVDEPSQVVYQGVPLILDEMDWRTLPEATQKQELTAYIQGQQQKNFDLSRPPLMRLALFQMAEDKYELVWNYHHLLFDGWSKSLIIRGLRARYEALCQSKEVRFEPALPYRNYINWLQQQDLSQAEAFWRSTLAAFSVPTAICRKELRPTETPDAMAVYEHREICLSTKVTAALQKLGRGQHVTLNTIVQGAWAVLLSRYSGEPDVVFGAVVSGRQADLEGIESMVGLFINTLPVRIRVSPAASLASWLQEIHSNQLKARQYEHSPLVDVQRWSEVPRGERLFQSILVFGNHPDAKQTSWAVTEWTSQRTGYPLHVLITPGNELRVKLTYELSRFGRAEIDRMLGHLQTLFEGMIADPSQCLARLPLLTEAEERQIAEGWNDTRVDFPPDGTFSQLFEDQARQTPDAVAAACDGQRLTYKDANRYANRVGHALAKCGVHADVIVPLMAARGLDWLTALLGVFKSGGAYLPLDPRHPAGRIRRILEQSGSQLVMVTREFLPLVSEALESWSSAGRPRLLVIEDLLRDGDSEEPLFPRSGPSDLAYVIYTSGSTGTPKGAMVENAGMLNHLYAKIKDLNLGPGDIVAQTASQCFDISVWQLLAALLVGGQVEILSEDVVREPALLLKRVKSAKVSILEVVPSLLRAVIAELERHPARKPSKLRWMILTGEALPPELCRGWLNLFRDVPLLNAYGPTECSDDVSHCVIDRLPDKEAERVSIGRPIANTRLYILDPELNPVPIGIDGELCVGGVGVGRGYLNDRDQTNQSFIKDPFVDDSAARLYKTGDLARWREDGNIDLLGRLDHQVKIRGFRIELGEVEAVLAQHPGVSEAVVIAHQDGKGESSLVAYLIAARGEEPSASDVKSFLEKKLPAYMIPSITVWLKALPLTSNGKVNRRALPAPAPVRPGINGHLISPRTQEEQMLASIWADVLGVERLSVHDNFFELGGNSLSATRVLARLPEEIQARLSLRKIFEAPTIARLAAELEHVSVADPEPAIQPMA